MFRRLSSRASQGIVAFFSLKNIATHPSVLMSTLKNVGAFAVLAAIAYFGFANEEW